MSIDKVPGLLVQAATNEFVGDLFRQGIRQLLALPEALQKLADSGLPVTSYCRNFPATHSTGEMQNEYSLVVHMQTP